MSLSANTEITNTQTNINNLNNSAQELNNQASSLQSQINNSDDQIANLERLANDANANGDIAEAQKIEDQLAAQKASQLEAQRQLIQNKKDQAKLKNEIDNANKRLAEQERQRQVKAGELQAAQTAKEDLTNELLQDLAKSDDVQEDIANQLEANGVDSTALENVDLDSLKNPDGSPVDSSEVLSVLEEETAKGNITLNEDGTLNVDKEAVVESQNQSNPQGYCMEKSGFCVSNERSIEYITCQTKPEEEQQACTQDVARAVTKDYISGGEECASKQSPEADSCRNAGRIYNCEFNQCLTEGQVNELGDQGAKCMELEDQEAKDTCFNEVKNTAIEKAAVGEFCLKESSEAKSCEQSGKSWNCNIDFCADEYQNKAIKEAVVECQNKPTKEEREYCMEYQKENGHYLLASACAEAEAPEGLKCSEEEIFGIVEQIPV